MPRRNEGVGEHGEEGLDVLRGGEGGEGDDAGGVVDEGDEVGLSPGSAVTDLRPVHDIAHPQLAGIAEGEAAAVGAVVGLGIEQALAVEQPVHGGGGEGVVDAGVAGGADDGAHRPGWIGDLEPNETRGELWGHAPGVAAVGARFGVQRLEAAIAVELDPVADGVGGDPGSGGAGDGVGLGGFVAHPRDEARCTHGQMHQVGDHAIPEQGGGLAQFVVGMVQPRAPRRLGGLRPGRRTRYAGDGGGSDPILCWRARVRFVAASR